MENLEKVIQMLVGNFNNKEQYDSMSQEKQMVFPYAVHNNYILNDSIVDIPEGFKGVFIYEESYYTLKGKEKFKSDIFLFLNNQKGKVVLKSITAPKNITNCKYEELKDIDFKELVVSEKFTPLEYTEQNNVFTGKSRSMFTKTTEFILSQEISSQSLIIKEEMYNGNKKVFGFDCPIVYKRI